MDIPVKAKVYCSDGLCGESTFVVLMPASGKITHVVVNDRQFQETEYMVSVDHITGSTPESIQLDCSREELSKMLVFNQVEFIPFDLTGLSVGPYVLWPYYTAQGTFVRHEHEHIPVNELAIRREARVEAKDGTVGRVDEFLINPDNDSITHLILREGHLWGQKDVTIPVGLIDRYEENTIHLKVGKHDIEALPAIPVQRNVTKKE